MSPEQASGKEVDRRSDIWSLGVILYEMIAGRRPFAGDYEAAVAHSILHEEPEPLTSRRSNVPMELERFVGKALAKNASERYPHVEDMLVDLRGLRSGTETHNVAAQTRRRGKRGKAIIAGVAAVIVVALAVFTIHRLTAPAESPAGQRSAVGRTMLVVLPFENLGAPEDEYFANGTTDAITARLASVSGLGVISRQSAIQYKKTTKSVRQIGKELGVDYILEGTVQRERPGDPASRVRVIPQLIRVADDTHVWAQTYDESMVEVFRVQSDIAERVAAQLNVSLLEPERRAIEKRPTENLAAYEHYLRGEEHRLTLKRLSDADLAVEEYRKAVALDPRFVDAWAGLAIAYREIYWSYERPGAFTHLNEAAKRAEAIAPDHPGTHLALGWVEYISREFEKALGHFEKSQRLRPSADAAKAIGYTLRRLGRWQQALDHFKEAHRLMPHNYQLYVDDLGYTNIAMRRYDEAEENYNEALALDPRVGMAYFYKARILLARDGDVEGAKKVLREMSRRVDVEEAAEHEATAFIEWTAPLRVLSEQYAEYFDAFEQKRMKRLRTMQPAQIANIHLAQALIIGAKEGARAAIARYDSARVCFERLIKSNPQTAYISSYRAGLGLAYAGLGRKKEAMREGKEAARIMPLSKDPISGEQVLTCVAEIYVMCGEYESAMDAIEMLLSAPGYTSPAMLRVDPIWDPIRSNPRFRRLAEGKRP